MITVDTLTEKDISSGNLLKLPSKADYKSVLPTKLIGGSSGLMALYSIKGLDHRISSYQNIGMESIDPDNYSELKLYHRLITITMNEFKEFSKGETELVLDYTLHHFNDMCSESGLEWAYSVYYTETDIRIVHVFDESNVESESELHYIRESFCTLLKDIIEIHKGNVLHLRNMHWD